MKRWLDGAQETPKDSRDYQTSNETFRTPSTREFEGFGANSPVIMDISSTKILAAEKSTY
jgi:hypothetical protein